MCSVNDDEDGKVLMEKTESMFKLHTLCRKCGTEEAAVVLQKKFPYCRECFIPYVTHKFFACLGKEKIMKPNDKVLLLCSGSQSSAVLLHLIKHGVEQKKKKTLAKNVVLFIDDYSLFPETIDFRVNLISEIKSMLTKLGFTSETFYSPLALTVDGLQNMSDLSWCTEDFLKINQTQSLFDNASSNSAKRDLLEKLRMRVAVNVAKSLGCNKIFSAETSDHSAVRILTNIALGRGSQLALDVGFADTRFEDVLIVRPLREWSRKEVAFYRHLHQLPFVVTPKLGTLKGNEDSVQKLTEAFVVELQVNFPSTVNTVLGTGNKLSTRETFEASDICILCKAQFNTSPGECSAISARNFSHELSTLGPSGFDSCGVVKKNNEGNSLNCEERCNSCSCSKNSSLSLDAIRNYFCYGCQLIIRDLKDVNTLPRELLEEAKERKILEEMRNSIQDYLI